MPNKSERNWVEIKIWLLRRGLHITELARAIGVDRTNVSKTIAGKRNNRAVLQWLYENGCPVRLLALPSDMHKRQTSKEANK